MKRPLEEADAVSFADLPDDVIHAYILPHVPLDVVIHALGMVDRRLHRLCHGVGRDESHWARITDRIPIYVAVVPPRGAIRIVPFLFVDNREHSADEIACILDKPARLAAGGWIRGDGCSVWVSGTRRVDGVGRLLRHRAASDDMQVFSMWPTTKDDLDGAWPQTMVNPRASLVAGVGVMGTAFMRLSVDHLFDRLCEPVRVSTARLKSVFCGDWGKWPQLVIKARAKTARASIGAKTAPPRARSASHYTIIHRLYKRLAVSKAADDEMMDALRRPAGRFVAAALPDAEMDVVGKVQSMTYREFMRHGLMARRKLGKPLPAWADQVCEGVVVAQRHPGSAYTTFDTRLWW